MRFTARRGGAGGGEAVVRSRRMSPQAAVQRAIARAERILPGTPASEDKRDPRWQAILRVGEFIEAQPEAVWQFAHRWGKHAQADLRMAIATVLLEHLLEYHFELLFPRVRQAALSSPRFADTLGSCWLFGQAEVPKNATRIDRLKRELRSRSTRKPTVARRPPRSRAAGKEHAAPKGGRR